MFKAVRILFIFIGLTMGANSFAQVINLPFDDETIVKLLLRRVHIIDSEKYVDFSFSGGKQKYFLGIDFGRKRFDVAVHNAETGEHISTALTLIGQSYFTKIKAADNVEEYNMLKNGVNYTVTFREVIPSLRINQRTISLFIKVRDTVNKKYLYMASDFMYF